MIRVPAAMIRVMAMRPQETRLSKRASPDWPRPHLESPRVPWTGTWHPIMVVSHALHRTGYPLEPSFPTSPPTSISPAPYAQARTRLHERAQRHVTKNPSKGRAFWHRISRGAGYHESMSAHPSGPRAHPCRYSLFDAEAAVGYYSLDLAAPEDRLIMRARARTLFCCTRRCFS